MNQNKGLFAGPVVMLLSAAIFGFFGFFRDWSAPFPDGKVILFMVLLGWTLRISACVFFLSGILALAKPVVGNLLYALAGIGSAGLFVVVAVIWVLALLAIPSNKDMGIEPGEPPADPALPRAGTA